MRVEIHRDADLAVPERLHHDSGVNGLSDQQRGAGVPQSLETNVTHASAGYFDFNLRSVS